MAHKNDWKLLSKYLPDRPDDYFNTKLLKSYNFDFRTDGLIQFGKPVVMVSGKDMLLDLPFKANSQYNNQP